MNTTKMIGFAVAAFVSASAMADFSFNAGYSWRSQAKTSFKGTTTQITPKGGEYDGNSHAYAADANDKSIYSDWAGGTIDHQLDSLTANGRHDFALVLNRGDSVASGSDEASAQGLTASVGVTFYDDEAISLGATLRFAGYWGIKNSTAGGYAYYKDTFRFTGVHYEDDINYVPSCSDFDYPNYEGRDYLLGGPGGRVTLKSDLYQIGFGPKATWHALSFLDVYGGVEALCCFTNNDLDAGGASTSEVNNLWGVGGHLGFTGYITENLGIFGQVGYEWIDEDDVSIKGIHAKTDYSSLVISAGLQYRF